MKLGVLFFVLADIKDYLVRSGLLLDNGDFINFDLQSDFLLVQVIEKSLKEHGVVIKEEVDKVINALPLLASFIH